ncbi:MAG: cadherin-like domain-containing protein [Synechococcales bacterium]|nr:cadherin-like domain-containing protein [Synechococcales bacterium]
MYYLRVFQKKGGRPTAYRLQLDSRPVAISPGSANTSPAITSQTGNVNAGDTLSLNNSLLQATDAEDNDQSLVYTLTALPQQGRLELNGVELAAGSQFTQTDIDAGRLQYFSRDRGQIVQVTNNDVNDVASGISGVHIVLNRVNAAGNVTESDNLNDLSREVYLYDVSQGNLVQITNNNLPDFPTGISGSNVVGNTVGTFFGQPAPSPFFYNGSTGQLIPLETGSPIGNLINNLGFPPVIKGSSIVWSAVADINVDFEVFFYDIASGETTQITNDGVNQIAVDVAGNNILWNTISLQGESDQVFWYNGATQTVTQLSAGNGPNAAIGISESKIAWTGSDGNDLEIFLYDIATGVTTQITDNDVDDVGVQVSGLSGANLVWNQVGENGDDTEVFFYDGASGVTRQLTNNDVGDVALGISGANIIWSSFDENNRVDEVFFYNGTTGITTQVTNSENSSFAVGVSGDRLVWNSFDGNDMEVFYADFGSSTGSDRFEFTVTDSGGASTNGTFTINIA